MSRWFRFYDTVLDDPKVQRLPAPLFKTWVNLLCLASRLGGTLPNVSDMAWTLRMDEDELGAQVQRLIDAGLLEKGNDTFAPHNWNERQFQSDTSTSRVQKFRDKKRNVSCNDERNVSGETPVNVVDTDTEEETDTEENQNRDEEAAPSAGHQHQVYAFEAGKIRLVETDLARWVKAFSNINVEAELHSLSDWAGKQPDWFHAVKGALGKRDRAAMLAKEKIKAEAAHGAKNAASKSFLERGKI